MKQPFLVILDLPEGSNADLTAEQIKVRLADADWGLKWVIPVQRTDGVPAGALT